MYMCHFAVQGRGSLVVVKFAQWQKRGRTSWMSTVEWVRIAKEAVLGCFTLHAVYSVIYSIYCMLHTVCSMLLHGLMYVMCVYWSLFHLLPQLSPPPTGARSPASKDLRWSLCHQLLWSETRRHWTKEVSTDDLVCLLSVLFSLLV